MMASGSCFSTAHQLIDSMKRFVSLTDSYAKFCDTMVYRIIVYTQDNQSNWIDLLVH